MKVLVVFVPLENVSELKEAVFEAGGGKIGQYDQCCFQSQGQGQFRPLKGSQPHIGQENKLEQVEEAKIEFFCDENCIDSVEKAMMATHPYQTPAYYII